MLSREESHNQVKETPGRERKIAKSPSILINKEDIVYLDAGTTTEMMLEYLKEYDVVYVTNGITHARKLMNAGFKVHLIGGEIKAVTEALSQEALEQLDKYPTKGFFGTNGIDMKRGFTTPDQKEAAVKKKAMEQCQKRYILSDASKFNVISTIKFADLKKAEVITDHLENKEFKRITNIEEVFS